jgi:ferredoxin-NADP reductase
MIVKIIDRKEIAKKTMLVTFDTLGQDLNFKAGQFCTLTLLNPLYTDDRGNKRFLGFSTSPSDKSSFSITTRMGVSAFKRSLLELPLGTEVDISGIDGRINLPEDKTKPLVFIAGGIGISPVMGIIRHCRETSWPYSITLVYSNRDRESAPYLDELEMYARENQKFRLIAVMTADPGWSGEKRRVTSQFIKEYFPEPEKYLFYVTGTPRFVPSVFKEIRDSGASPLNIKMEIFTGY